MPINPFTVDPVEKLVFRSKPDKNLCYYTTQDGLMGIVESQSLYATDARYLNDSQEMTYAVRLAREYFSGQRRKSLAPPIVEALLFALNNVEILVRNVPTYVASFSEEPDLLSQWRGYCPNGSGFALCLSPDRITELAEVNGFQLLKCIYEEQEQFHILDKFYEVALSRDQEVATHFAVSLMMYGAALKHPSFSEENEWRATIRTGGTPSIRSGTSTLVPYINFPLTLSSDDWIELDGLMVGPTPHPELAKNAAWKFLQSKGVKCPEPTPSKIPFRSW